MLERAQRPIPLCNYCGEPMNARGKCTRLRADCAAGETA